ncbi:scarecrow-like protein 21 [Mangifera indica]|uniref:scarecrow-like protein 21 n=1 Tax=Mangifera indica TaxID=29780 RepID=UPI001CFA9B2D|nr:scarecrow-like protein 21 [Mangifera indica]XP_044473840.1 scarecrow-like protein 21 [Mangifera indica]
MDSQQLFTVGISSGGLSNASSHSTASPVAKSLIGSIKFDKRNSPNSPFSSQFECDAVTTLSDSPSCNSSLESTSYYHQLSPSVDSLALYPRGTSYVEKANCSQNIEYVLQEFETELMALDGDKEVSTLNSSYGESGILHASGHHRSRTSSSQAHQMLKPQPSVISRYRQLGEGAPMENHCNTMLESSLLGFPSINLKQLLIACAKALSENYINDFDKLIAKTRGAVSISGEPIQRLGAYMVEGLVARKEKSGSNIYHALRCREPDSKDLLSYMHVLYEICPYLKFGCMAANGAIAEACKNEDRIHIVDFRMAQGTQWMTLLQALASKPSGPPHVRITGIDDPVSKYARGYGLEAVGKHLAAISQKFNIPVEFHPVPVFASQVTLEMLDVRPGEALAVNFPLQLHHTPDESVDVNNPRDGLLRKIKSLNPRVVTLVEQESNTNTAAFLPRFIEALNYYLAMFESIDVIMPRDQKLRINVEQHCLARDIVNIIACEGMERVERHELFGKWKSRFTMAGFQQCPLSPYVNSVIKSLLRSNSEHYKLVETDGATLFGWKDRALISVSAWH